MEFNREIIPYKNYFHDFYSAQTLKIQEKIDYRLQILRSQRNLSDEYVKHIEPNTGIYELRMRILSNEYRILFFFESGSLIDGGKIVLLCNGFLKKNKKDLVKPLELALRLREEYFDEKAAQPISDLPITDTNYPIDDIN